MNVTDIVIWEAEDPEVPRELIEWTSVHSQEMKDFDRIEIGTNPTNGDTVIHLYFKC